ncbi:MAG: GAF domain-containing protein [Anaerolineae bacterium]|nr:GAF domain-containing protein [Anaerolineae bacterium]
MNLLHETLSLLTQPPGDLVYFLVTLFALQQMLVAALAVKRAAPERPLGRRWVVAAAGMLLGRGVLLIIGLLGTAEVIQPVAILPPVERCVTATSILLVTWALLGRRAARWQTWTAAALIVAAVVFCGYDTVMWRPLSGTGIAYNLTLYAWVWDLASVLLLGLAVVATLMLRSGEWEWSLGILGFWLLGRGMQLAWPDPALHISGWERLAELVVLPLWATLVQRLQSNQAETSQSPGRAGLVNTGSLDVQGFQELFERIEGARELEPSLIIASSQLAKLFTAEMCAIGLLEEAQPLRIRVPAIHPPTGLLEAPILDLTDFDALIEAWEAREPYVVQPPHLPDWLDELYHELGFHESGPLLMLPLCHDQTCVGAVFLGNPDSRLRWEVRNLALFRLTSALLAGAIDRTQRRGGSIFSLRETEIEMDETVGTLRSDVATLNQQIDSLREQVEVRERELTRLRLQLQSSSSSPQQPSETELTFWQNEVKELAKDRETLVCDRDRLAEELARLRPKLEQMTAQRATLIRKMEQLKKQLDTLRESPPGASLGLVVADESGAIVMADALGRQLLRLPQGEVTGTPLDGAYPDPQWARTVADLLSPQADARRRAHLTLPVGDLTVEADLVTLTGRDGAPDALVVTLRTEESLAEQQEAIVGIANEFRTPMTSIMGYTDLLLGEQAGILTGMQQQFLVRVRANVEQMGQLLNDLVQLASPDVRTVELAPEPVDLIGLIEEGIMGLASRFRERRLAVHMDLPDSLAPVRSDRDSLYQIMLRLLSNAALCSQEGTEIVVRAFEQEPEGDESGAYVRISVTDTGGGIAPEDFSRVFRRFYRAGQPLVVGMGETGVGMAVAKAMVEANGGRIWVETTPGVGSTFSFVLPAFTEDLSPAA